MEYRIVLDDDESALVEQIATQNKVTANAYLRGVVRKWLHPHMRAKYVRAAQTADITQLKTALADIVSQQDAAEAKKAAGG